MQNQQILKQQISSDQFNADIQKLIANIHNANKLKNGQYVENEKINETLLQYDEKSLASLIDFSKYSTAEINTIIAHMPVERPQLLLYARLELCARDPEYTKSIYSKNALKSDVLWHIKEFQDVVERILQVADSNFNTEQIRKLYELIVILKNIDDFKSLRQHIHQIWDAKHSQKQQNQNIANRKSDSIIYFSADPKSDPVHIIKDYCDVAGMEFIQIGGMTESEIAQNVDNAMKELQAKNKKAPILYMNQHGWVNYSGNHVSNVGKNCEQSIRTDVLQTKIKELPMVQKMGLGVYQTACFSGSVYSGYYNTTDRLAWLTGNSVDGINRVNDSDMRMLQSLDLSLYQMHQFIERDEDNTIRAPLGILPEIIDQNTLIQKKQYANSAAVYKKVRTVDLVARFLKQSSQEMHEFLSGELPNQYDKVELINQTQCINLVCKAQDMALKEISFDIAGNAFRLAWIAQLTQAEKLQILKFVISNSEEFRKTVIQAKNPLKNVDDITKMKIPTFGLNEDFQSAKRDNPIYEIEYVAYLMLSEHMRQYGENVLGYTTFEKMSDKDKERASYLERANVIAVEKYQIPTRLTESNDYVGLIIKEDNFKNRDKEIKKMTQNKENYAQHVNQIANLLEITDQLQKLPNLNTQLPKEFIFNALLSNKQLSVTNPEAFALIKQEMNLAYSQNPNMLNRFFDVINQQILYCRYTKDLNLMRNIEDLYGDMMVLYPSRFHATYGKLYSKLKVEEPIGPVYEKLITKKIQDLIKNLPKNMKDYIQFIKDNYQGIKVIDKQRARRSIPLIAYEITGSLTTHSKHINASQSDVYLQFASDLIKDMNDKISAVNKSKIDNDKSYKEKLSNFIDFMQGNISTIKSLSSSMQQPVQIEACIKCINNHQIFINLDRVLVEKCNSIKQQLQIQQIVETNKGLQTLIINAGKLMQKPDNINPKFSQLSYNAIQLQNNINNKFD